MLDKGTLPPMLVVKKLTKTYGIRTVLSGVSFALGKGQKAALVGPNGVGKSTLLKILAGLETPNRGEVQKPKVAGIGYLSQEVDALAGETVRAYVYRVSGLASLEVRMKALEPELAEADKLEEYTDIEELFRRSGGYEFEHRTKAILDGFRLPEDALDRPVAYLSGGQKSKVALTAILIKGVDILLLDEPTNNLDLPALVWLEEYLLQSSSTCLIASHDRKFLDHVVTKVLEIDWFRRDATLHTGTYTEYAERKALELRRLKEEYRLQQEELKRLQETALEKNDWAKKGAVQKWSDNDKMGRNFARDRSKKLAVTGKAIEVRMHQMDKKEKPEEREPLEIRLEPAPNEAKQGIELSNVVAGYDSFRIGPITLSIPFGARIGIVGANGSGKSTLLKAIVGSLKPLSGEVTRGESLTIGDFTQEHENLPREKTPVWLFAKVAEIYDADRISFLLHKFHLGHDALQNKIGDFSPGERARLLLALYSEMGVNVLILDEPTNHLDVEAIEALEEVLASYAGTVVLVSHDRSFLEKVPMLDIYLMESGRLKNIGSYEEYSASLVLEAKRMLRKLA
jgi:ATPase subunit of ABC transporter with duplicated ATPase domains